MFMVTTSTYFRAVPWVSFSSKVKESPLERKLSVRVQALDLRNKACSHVRGARSRQNRAISVALVGGRPTITDCGEVALDICTERSLSLKQVQSLYVGFTWNTFCLIISTPGTCNNYVIIIIIKINLCLATAEHKAYLRTNKILEIISLLVIAKNYFLFVKWNKSGSKIT